jgi:LMBR1 domain-containing protein 1
MYTIAIASLIGWILFAIFGGIGLVALPFDLLLEFKHRPRRIKLGE